MASTIVSVASVAAEASPRPAALRDYGLPLLFALIAFPVTALAVYASLSWIGLRFPSFLLMDNGVVPTVGTRAWPPDKPAVFHSQVVAVEDVPVAGSAEVFARIQSRAEGDEVRYAFLRDGRAEERRLPVRVFGVGDWFETYGILLLFGITNLAIGLTVGFLQPHTLQARVFAFHTFTAAIYAITGVFLHHPEYAPYGRVCLLIECIVAATFIHLALTFPVVRTVGGFRRWLLVATYGGGVVLAAWVLAGFDQQPPDLRGERFAYLSIAASLGVVAATMAYAYRENRSPRVRLQVKAVLPGVLLACAVPAIVFINNASAGPVLPVQSGLLAALPFYASIAYAIGKHDLFDIDRVVRLAFGYALLSLIVVAAYAGMLQLAAWLFPGAGGHGTIGGIVFVLVLAVALDPLRQTIQRVVDRALYRSRLDYRATISEISQVMTTLLDLGEIATQVTQRVAQAMQLETIALGLAGDGEHPPLLWMSRGGNAAEANDASGMDALVRWIGPSATGDSPREMPEEVRALLARTASVMVLPLVFDRRISGALLLGAKQSGQPLDSAALDLLRTLANQTAIAAENARSYRALEDLNRSLDAKVKQQTEDLRRSNADLARAYDDLKNAQAQLVQSEKMASLGQLVAGVAHELNNPASFVHGGLANLAEYLDRFVQVLRAYEDAALAEPDQAAAIASLRKKLRLDYLMRETPELLRVCFEGSERITRIVEDLRVFARADSGDRMPLHVREGIESTLRILAARLSQGGIVVDCQFGDVDVVEGDAGQLNQVWMNLLSNAIDALDGRTDGRITVAVRPAADEGWLEVEVTDNGPGVPEAARTRLFEPFYSTKPIGKGTGLGLSIAYGAVKSHGGIIQLCDESEGGARFVVRLPTSAAWRAAGRAA